MNKYTVAGICLTSLLLISGLSSSAQSRSETRLYRRTLGKPSVAAFDKFLKKYPSSVYADEITARKDTLLNISPYSETEAARILREQAPEAAEVLAFGNRREGIDRIYGVCIYADTLSIDYIRLYTLVKGRNGWSIDSYDRASGAPEGMAARDFADSTSIFKIRGKSYFGFNMLLRSADNLSQSYCAAVFCPEEELYEVVTFSGSNILGLGSEKYKIEGRSDFAMLAGTNRPEMQLLKKSIDDNPLLVAIPDDIYLTDAAIDWWAEHNPQALTSASNLSVNIIQPGSSLIGLFAEAKGKKNSSKYRAALIDTRGYTVIVAYDKAADNYFLAWAEPECKDHQRDRLLNSISFESASSLELFYYHGRRTFKYHLNLSSKSLSR